MWFPVMVVLPYVLAQVPPNQFGCDCMDYWKCIMSGGMWRSYCGLSATSVCCFIAPNAKPVGILPQPSTKTCGRKGADSHEEGVAEMAEWPWHTAILEKGADLYVCGGSLLDEQWVLTAAHCVDDYQSKTTMLKVRLGEYDVSTTSEPLRHEELDVVDLILHPSFDNSTLVNDIALLRLSLPAKRKPNIDAVCMPANDITDSNRPICYVTGWGRRSETTDHSVVLKEILVPLWNQGVCEESLRQQFGPTYSLPTTAICAGAEGRDACDGDGGGPLVCEKNGKWYQVGIVSFGIGCGRRNIPGVYTRVANFAEWIKNMTTQFS